MPKDPISVSQGPAGNLTRRQVPAKTNEDSGTNANNPSIAGVWPTAPPTQLENLAQLVPNWNSGGIPVTTPKVTLTAKTFVRNR